MTDFTDRSTQDIEERLGGLSLSAPDPGLRARTLGRAAVTAKPARLDLVVGLALATWVMVQVWGGWMERETAMRMARIGAPPGVEVRRPEQAPSKDWLRFAAQQVELAILHPRYRLPLGPGIHTTRLDAGRMSMTSLSVGDPS